MKKYVAFFAALLLAIAWGFSTIQPAKSQGYIEPWRGIIVLCNTNDPPACSRWRTTQTYQTRGECYEATREQAERLVNRTRLERPTYRFNVGVRCVAEQHA